jgi:Asp-tRNA(Asn)/Glu-tRNA(Gln) amidotransferase A subunit family amidase
MSDGRALHVLPLAVQLAAPAGADARLLAVAAWCEREPALRARR